MFVMVGVDREPLQVADRTGGAHRVASFWIGSAVRTLEMAGLVVLSVGNRG
jgi:hypothetical protein